MFNRRKRLFLSFLFILFVLCSKTVQAEDVITITEKYVNPIYDNTDLNVKEEAPTAAIPDVFNPDIEEEDTKVIVDEEGEAIADMIREAMTARKSDVSFSYTNTTGYDEKNLQNWFELALKETDNSQEGDYLRWNYEKYEAQISYYRKGGIYYYDYVMTITYYTTAQQEEELNKSIERVLTDLDVDDSTLTDYEKTKRIYDYICANVTYDYDTLEIDSYKLKFTAYAAMVQGTAVCQGYATLMYRMLEECDIDTRVIFGVSFGENHTWNIVNLGSVYYLADSTWDAGKDEYSYFLTCKENFDNHDPKSEFFYEYPLAKADYVPVTVTLNKNELALKWEESEQLTATVESEVFADVQWTSSDEKVATVDEDGNVTAIGDGVAVIKAAVPGDKAVCEVTVTHDHVEKVSIEAKEPTCTEEGCTQEVSCELCGQVLAESLMIEALGHVYVDKICSVCGEIKPHSTIIFVNNPVYRDYTGKPVEVPSEKLDLSKGNAEFYAEYYLDEECLQPTYEGKTGKEKSAPVNIGVYYVRIICPENEDYQYTESEEVLKYIVCPGPVTSLKAENQKSSIKLTWKKSSNADSYIIYRKTNNSDFEVIKKITNKDTVSYVDKNISQGKKYIYNIAACKTVKGKKITGSRRTENTAIVRTKVTGITNQNGSVKITWTKVSDAAGYKVYRKAAGQSTYALLKNIKSGDTVSYTDKLEKSIRNGKKSQYYILPYYETKTNVVTKTNIETNYYVKRPAIAKLTTPKAKSLKVTWKKNDAATDYQVRYSITSSMDRATVKNTKLLNKTFGELKTNKKYYVQVRAYKKVDGKKYYSAWSAKKSLVIK